MDGFAPGDMDRERRQPIPHIAVIQPSTNSKAPVTYEASSEARNRIAAETSSALPGRFSMVPCAALALYCSTVSPAAAMRRSWNGVKIGPGPTAFTRMPSAEWSAASARVRPAIAALVVSYCRLPPPATTERTDAVLTMAPPLLRRINGIAALAQLT